MPPIVRTSLHEMLFFVTLVITGRFYLLTSNLSDYKHICLLLLIRANGFCNLIELTFAFAMEHRVFR